ncbi:hypothetical protein [Thermococcus sp.]|uniref:hypothetical protein n=1 Tax=Thermococcus sp. TaxID=35749 RepID=UPI0026248266|nr:hypothetical protein [Thermococcus sp.]
MSVPQSGSTLFQLVELIGSLLIMGIVFYFILGYIERSVEKKEKEINEELKEEEETGDVY